MTGGKRGFLKPVGHSFVKDEPLLILQHPEAEPLKLAIGAVVTPDDGQQHVTYKVNTKGGSSGSPCFTSALDPVAIHHFGRSVENQGVNLGAILQFLRSKKLGHLLEPVKGE